jgi:hypothetical protein
MKRRLLVAKAMVHSPPVLVLDEPTAGVDIELRQQLWDYVRELNATRRHRRPHHALSRRSRGIVRPDRDHQPWQADRRQADARTGRHGAREDRRVTVDREVADAPLHPSFDKTEKIGERTLAISYDKDRANAGEVLARCRRRASGSSMSTTREPDLEDVFLEADQRRRHNGEQTYDVIIIGSGAAGLTAALTLAQDTRRAGARQGRARSAARPPGRRAGSRRCSMPGDTFESHVEDTMIAGAGLNNRKTVEFVIERPARDRAARGAGRALQPGGSSLRRALAPDARGRAFAPPHRPCRRRDRLGGAAGAGEGRRRQSQHHPGARIWSRST